MIPEFTRNNHFQFGYNNQLWNHGDQQNDHIIYRYGRSQRIPLDVKTEGIMVASEISKKAGSDLVLLLSGGIDSEVMVRLFMSAGIKIRCVITKFNNNLNWHDIKYGIDFCHRYDIPYCIYNLDIISFYESGEYEEYAMESQCPSPQFVTYMWLIDQLSDFFPVFTHHPPIIYNSPEGFDTFVNFQQKHGYKALFLEDITAGTKGELDQATVPLIEIPPPGNFSIFRFLKKRNIQGVPLFYHYTPEFTLAWLKSLPVLNYVNQKEEFKNEPNWTYEVKRKLYDLNFGFKDMAYRPRGGGGFEEVKKYFKNKSLNYDQEFRKPLLEKLPNAMDKFVVQFDDFLQFLEPSIADDNFKNNIF